MSRESILKYVKRLGRPIFTTHDMQAMSGKSLSAVVQGLNHLRNQGAVVKLRRGIWAEAAAEPLSPFLIIPYLPSGSRTYLSFLSALHLHGIIEQIPQQITCASVAHSRTIATAAGVFAIHRIAPAFFFGFDWYRDTAGFLTAVPEKALLDCLYLSGRKGKRFAHFPELHLPPSFSFAKARHWTRRIADPRLRSHVLRVLDRIQRSTGTGA
jgi:predicted transcriptional regulator of viral defense system